MSAPTVPTTHTRRPARADEPSRTHRAPDADALLRRLTLEEKIGQMTQLTVGALAADGTTSYDGRIRLDAAKLRRAVAERHIGSVINVLDAALPASEWQSLVRQLQDAALGDMSQRDSAPRVPLLYGIDFVHGANYAREGTIFPHNVGLAAAFDPELVRRIGEVTAAEAHACGLLWNFAPVLDVGRNPLWPRFYETFGEDVHVVTRLGTALVEGLQQSGHVSATLKHFLGYSASRLGRDRTTAPVTEREMRELYLPPFRAAVAAGARSIMVNSGDVDGEPLHASRFWLTDVLRGELGFDGVIVTDWEDIGFLHTRHRVAPTMRDAVRMAVDAGVDVCMAPFDFQFTDALLDLVRDGTIAESRIDESVRRVLALKASLGVLGAPYPDAALLPAIGAPASVALARQAASDSITLLKNDGVLPLPRGARVMVTGPGASSATALCGGWSYTWQGNDAAHYPAGTVTLAEAIRAAGAHVTHVGSHDFGAPIDVDAAVAAAREADVAIVVLGEEGYAEWAGDLNDLTLPAAQIGLAKAVQATGTPTVLVLLEGRPRIIREIADGARAIVMAYWPGREGAGPIADVLFGAANPSGRLPFTYPRHPNALQTYDHRTTETLDAAIPREAPGGFDPQFPFGHGIGYTTFAYGALTLDRATIAPGDSLGVSVTVTNTGARAGRETVLLYVRQHYASVAPPVRRLRAFDRVSLEPGESRTVRFTLSPADMSYVGRCNHPVLEAGAFDVIVGDLAATFHVCELLAR